MAISSDPKCVGSAHPRDIVLQCARDADEKSVKLPKAYPQIAEDSVTCPPVSCIPSPESPANLTTTASGLLLTTVSSSVILFAAEAIQNILRLFFFVRRASRAIAPLSQNSKTEERRNCAFGMDEGLLAD